MTITDLLAFLAFMFVATGTGLFVAALLGTQAGIGIGLVLLGAGVWLTAQAIELGGGDIE